jgi:hypothetical protein
VTLTYLYGHGRRRHIAANEPTRNNHGARSFCGDWHMTAERMAEECRRWVYGPVAERTIRRKLAMPVCQRCENGARRAGRLAAADVPAEDDAVSLLNEEPSDVR